MAEEPAECVFCQIVRGDAESRKLYEDDEVVVILDTMPRFGQGQCVVISKRHVTRFYELEDHELCQLFRAAKVMAQKLEQTFSPDAVAMFARGRGVPHAHVLLYPATRRSPMDRFFEGAYLFSELAKTTEEELDSAAQRLRDASAGG